MKTRILPTLAIAATLVGSPAFAGNITIPDNDATPWSWGPGGPGQVAGEDSETERSTVQSQAWDMEGLFINSRVLSMVGGYDLVNGNSGYTTGDLFIKVRGTAPGYLPTSTSFTTVPNSLYDYTFVVDLSSTASQGLPTGASTASVYLLNSTSVLDTVAYDWMQSNPWRYNSGAVVAAPITTAVTYSTGVAAYNAVFAGGSGTHNVTTVDLQFLYDLGYLSATNPVLQGPVWFSYTMQCGNDSIKGEWNNGFDQVPDSSSTIVLIALGVAAGLTQLPRRRRE